MFSAVMTYIFNRALKLIPLLDFIVDACWKQTEYPSHLRFSTARGPKKISKH